MEGLMDFDEWLKNYKHKEPEYVAVFDPQTGIVKSVGPDHAFQKEQYKVAVDRELAESIIEGTIHIGSCFVDIHANVLEVAQVKRPFNLDDVLHRIVDSRFTDIENPDVYLIYNSKNNTLKIKLSEELGGTHKLKDPQHSFKPRKIIWDGDVELNFLITKYNDPNLFHKLISVKINELVGKSKVVKDINYGEFSVYTRRLFKNYIIEHK